MRRKGKPPAPFRGSSSRSRFPGPAGRHSERPAADYVAAILITIQRLSVQEHGSVQLDGLDVAPIRIVPPPPKY